MLPQNNPDRIGVVFDDHRLVANAGLLLPATLAQHLGLRELVDHHLDLGCASGRANTGDKLLTLVASALAGGDFIDDADALRAGGTVGVLGCVVKAPSTLGTFLRSFRWGHVRQLDRVSRQLLARAWAAGAGPGDLPLTIDLDSTICETYGLDKEGARHHNYIGARGYHPLLAIAAGTGDVLMSRLREGRANTARGAAHFLRETVGRVRYGGASGQLTVRADSGFYAHALVAVCREMGVRFSITIRQHKGLRELIEAIPEQDWTPIPYWMDGAADVAETTYAAFAKPDIYEYLEERHVLYAIRLPGNEVLQREIAPLLRRPVGRPPKRPVILYDDFWYRAGSWDRARRVVAKVEWHRGELFPRVGFIVTNMTAGPEGAVRFYNGRGTAEQWIKEGKYALNWTRLSCHRFVANRVRLSLFVLAYNLGNFLRRLCLPKAVKHWSLRSVQVKLIKMGGRLVRHARRLIFQLSEVSVPRRLFQGVLDRIGRLSPAPS